MYELVLPPPGYIEEECSPEELAAYEEYLRLLDERDRMMAENSVPQNTEQDNNEEKIMPEEKKFIDPFEPQETTPKLKNPFLKQEADEDDLEPTGLIELKEDFKYILIEHIPNICKHYKPAPHLGDASLSEYSVFSETISKELEKDNIHRMYILLELYE